MAEPYVPIAQLTTYQGIMTEIEVTSIASEPNTDALELATNNALIARNTAETALDSKFNILLLVGC
jgi:hypothetical protein